MARSGQLTVKLTSLWGTRKNTKVTLRQVENEILFGIGPSAFLHPNWKTEVAKFNFATIPFYWAYIEPIKGVINTSAQRVIVDWCKSKSIKTKAHPVVYKEVIPPWKTDPITTNDMTRLVNSIMGNFRDIDYWDVVNEPIHTQTQILEAYKLAESYSKNLIVNEYGVLPSDTIGFKQYCSTLPYQVGLQCHIAQNEEWHINPVVNEINKYNAPHISEVSITSAVENSSQAMLWSEQKQADYLVSLYTAIFNQTNARSITWWNLSDGDPWRPHIGLIRTDGTKKPAYHALESLLKGWKTTFTGVTNNSGELAFSGYYGVYEVIVDGRVKGKISLTNAAPYGTIRY